ncbi:MAG: hypothetical protein AB8H79_11035 [Myxococcota bacterium]
MIHALGYSQTEFDAANPGRLCRGRERWIEPFELDGPHPLIRLVLTGAAFTDDSARDALRGLQNSKVPIPALIAALFPRRKMLAFMEDGHPADIPDDADGVEVYSGHRSGGLVEEPMVRWHKPISGVRDLKALLGEDAAGDPVRGLVVLADQEDADEDLLNDVFLFTGMSTVDSPPARYQPSAMPTLLDRVKAIIVLHRDKHGPAIGIYSRDPIKLEGRLQPLADKHGCLLVRFAIPPMLARWDRALAELREEWMNTHTEEFPVPPAPEPSNWEPRRRRSKRGVGEGVLPNVADEDLLVDESADSNAEE